MAINPLFRSSPTRMMGLSSGMDTDMVIQQTLRLHQMRIDAQMRSKKVLEWRQQTHNSIKDQIAGFRNSFLTGMGPNAMMNRNVFNSTVATLSGKNSDAVTISTTLNSTVGSLTIGKIESLAKGASATSAGSVSSGGGGFLPTAKLGDISFSSGGDLFAPGEDETTITINDKSITLTKDDTINSMINKINSSGAGVRMSYDRLSDKFKLESTTVNSTLAGDLRLGGDMNAFELFGLSGAGSVQEDGTLARVQINGEWVTSATNSFEFRGINITLNRTTDGTVTTGGVTSGNAENDITVNLKRDATEAINRIKGFIDSYNVIIKRLEGLLKERKTTGEASYGPLTDEEKSAMSDKQIEEWEAIAKKGILRNDAGIQSLVTSLRRALFDSVSSAGMSPSEIGLTTGNFFGETGGQIVLDEERLRAALERDPEKVANVFIGSTDLEAPYAEKGLLRRINDSMRDFVNTNQTYTLKSLENSIRRANEQLDKMQLKMFAEEDKLYKQFAAMESALSKLQSQGDWMTAMLGGAK